MRRAALLTLVLAIGCRRGAAEVRRDPTPVVSITAPAPPVPKVPADLRVVLLRTMCYGECPAYAVIVEPSGHVTFVGEAFVMAAHAEAMLTTEQMIALVGAIDESRFDSLSDVNLHWKDCARSKTTVTRGGHTRSVRDGCVGAGADEDAATSDETRLEKLGAEIDRIVGTERWIGPESKRQRLFDEPDAASAKTAPELDYWK